MRGQTHARPPPRPTQIAPAPEGFAPVAKRRNAKHVDAKSRDARRFAARLPGALIAAPTWRRQAVALTSFPQGGGCQCGAVRYEITGPPTVVYACHCTECQRQSGAAFAMAAVIPRAQFRLTQGEPKMFPRRINATKVMECWYCADCGTRLYHIPGGAANPNRNIKPGTLDDTSWLRPTVHFWTRSAQPWVPIPEGATRHETQPDSLPWMTPAAE